MIEATHLLAGVPPALRQPLFDEYRGLVTSYIEGKWKFAGLDAGRFCEVAFTIVEGAVLGTYPAAPKKPDDFPGACRALTSKTPVAVGDRTLRILLPRVLPPIYEIRNNRDIGHVGGDVASNKMDATYVVSSCSFVLAELVRVFHGCSVGEAQSSVDAIVERRTPLVWDYGGGKRVLAPDMGAADKSLLLLYAETDWTSVNTLCSWVKYSNPSVFRTKVLGGLDKVMLIELNRERDSCKLTPLGIKSVEERLLHR